jgi:hypothetical protein
MASLTKARQDRGATVTSFSSDFDEIFPPAEVREQAELRRKHIERWYDLIVGAAILGALLAFLYFFASAAFAATTNLQADDDVQAKINAASSGDTFIVYGTPANPVLLANVAINKPIKFSGAPASYMASRPNQYAFTNPTANNVEFDGLTFSGNLLLNRGDFHPDGWKITNCKFYPREGVGNPPGWPSPANWCLLGWTANGSPTNMKFTGNDVGPVESWTVLFMYQGRNIEIAHNIFHDRQTPGRPQTQGRYIKGFGQGKDDGGGILEGRDNRDKLTCGNIWIHHNLFQRWRGMAEEMQDGWADNVYEDNYYEQPLPFPTSGGPTAKREDHLDTWISSKVETRSVGMKSRRNYFDARMPAGTPLVCFRVVEELGGFGFESTDNYIVLNGPNVGPDNSSNVSWAVNGTNCSGAIRNNRIVNGPGPVGSNLNPAKVTVANNTATTPLTWDINRPKPGTAAGPATQPTFAAALVVTGDTTADLYWPSQQGASSYTIQTKTSQGVDDWKTLGSVTDSPAKIVGFHGGWEYDARVISGNQTSTAARKRIGDISLSTQPFPNNPALAGAVVPEPPQPIAKPIDMTATLNVDGTVSGTWRAKP